MTPPAEPATNELGDYYQPGDYAGLFRRLVIIVVDLATLAGAFLAVSVIDSAVSREESRGISSAAVYSWLAFAYVYFVFLEASPIGTLGFLLTGVKIVTLEGRRPSFIRMTF